MVRTLCFIGMLAAGCGGGPAPMGADMGVNMGGPDMAGPCDDPRYPCAAGERCYLKRCVPDRGTCMSNRECLADTRCECIGGGGGDGGACMGGICVPWGSGPPGTFDPSCQGVGFLATAFRSPEEKCHFTPQKGESANVVMTPLVIDLDRDGKPEIVFGNFSIGNGGLIAIHGADCTPYFENPMQRLLEWSQLAAADLDGDGFPEIIGVDLENKIVVFDHQGKLLATADEAYVNPNPVDCVAPAIADVDGDGLPEILIAAQILHYNKMKGLLDVVWNKEPSTGLTAKWGTLSVFADLNGDGKAEVLTGLKVFDGVTGADKTPSAMAMLKQTAGAFPQVADFNGDKKPDVLLVQARPAQQLVTVVDIANNRVIFGPHAVAGGGFGGPATIADFDGDGVPDIGVAGPDHYYVYALKCSRNPKPVDCVGTDPGVLWSRGTVAKESGGGGSSAFDFNGDGRAEVVYRDKCWLRVMDGRDGKTLFARQVTAATCTDTPVTADVDGDGHAELIVASDSIQGMKYCAMVPEGQTGQMPSGVTQGVFVLRDPGARWMGARPAWNQQSYHITNINDDGTVPKSEAPSWTAANTYRANQSRVTPPTPMADLTAGLVTRPAATPGAACDQVETLRANVCNRGALAVDAGVAGTFYDRDPRGGGVTGLCTARTMMALMPGACETVFCDWVKPVVPADLWFRVTDDGAVTTTITECNYDNDVLPMPGTKCP